MGKLTILMSNEIILATSFVYGFPAAKDSGTQLKPEIPVPLPCSTRSP